MLKGQEKVIINGVEYKKSEFGNKKAFSRFDRNSKMEVINVFNSGPGSGARMEAFKRSMASLINESS